jgi:hypothetical protein
MTMFRRWLPPVLLLLTCGLARAAVVAEWDFARGPAGWKDEAGSTPDTSAQGTRWLGTDKGLSLRSPALNLPTEAFQAIEISLTFEGPGLAQLLWQGAAFGRTQSGWHGPLPVQVPSDGQVHNLRLLPFWQNVKTLEGLRLVAPADTRIRLRSLRVLGSVAAAGEQVAWDFSQAVQAGQWLTLAGGALLRPQADGLQATLNQPSALLVSQPLDVPAFNYEWLSAKIRTTNLQQLWLRWACSGQKGLHGAPLTARPGVHVYNVRSGSDRSWAGVVRGLACEIAGPPGGEAVLQTLGLYTAPQGDADLQELYAGPVEAVVRAGRPFRFAWVLQNTGGREAKGIGVTATAGEGLSLMGPQPKPVERMDFGVPQTFLWQMRAERAGELTLQVAYGDSHENRTVKIDVEPGLPALGVHHVPPPRPSLPPKATLAVLYRTPPPAPLGPDSLDRLLYRRPYLGDYGIDPEVMDWQIKWCLESGIGAWIMDVGDNTPEARDRATLDAFLGTAYGRQMKFCLRWTAPIPSVATGQRLLGQELAPLLAQANYLRMDGKPVVFIAHPLQRGNEGWGLADLQELAASTGLCFVACLTSEILTPDLLKRAGYAACVDLDSEEGLPRRAWVADDWGAAAEAGIPHLPCLQPAWRTAMSPARLATLTKLALLRASRAQTYALPCVVLGAYNGEDGLEPCRPYGFDYLEAVRQAVGGPQVSRVLPDDVGLGPYDQPLPEPTAAWEFDTKDTWTSAMGLGVLHTAGGMLTGQTDTDSPALFGGDTLLDTRLYGTLALRLSVSAGRQGRLYWRTSLRKFVRENSLPFKLIADSVPHEYKLDVSGHPGWRGYIEGLRLDPTDAAGATIALDYVRILPRQ